MSFEFFKVHRKLIISVSLCVVLFVGGLLGFVIIPALANQFKPVNDGPSVLATVSGNGGNAVMVGEYLYFTSGYISTDTIVYKQNEYNNVKEEGAIWRVKMTDGAPVYDNSYMDDVDDWKDYEDMSRFDPFQKYAEYMDKQVKEDDLKLIVPKIAGWSNSAIWIFDNTLVYASPNNQKDKHGVLQLDKIDFFKVNLDGSGHKRLYTTTSTSVTTSDFTVVHVDGATYLLCHDGTSLVRVGMDGKKVTISETVESFVFPKVSGYFEGFSGSSLKDSYSDIMSYVFYTETRDEEEDVMRGNILMRYDIAGNETKKLWHDHYSYTLLALGSGMLALEVTPETGSAKSFYVITDDIDDFTLTGLKSYKMAQPLKSEDKLYISSERTKKNSAAYITHTDSRLFIYSPYESSKNANYSPVQIAGINDVGEVIDVTTGSILYKTSAGALKCIDYSGNVKEGYESGTPSSNVEGARITAFQVLNANGQVNGTGYMFFYIKTITEVSSDDTSSDTETEGEVLDTITVGVVIDALGREYILAILDEKFLQMPE